MMTSLAATSALEWEDLIPYALMAYRSTIHASTTYTPAYLTFGRELSYPLEFIIGLPDRELKYVPITYAQQTQRKLVEVY